MSWSPQTQPIDYCLVGGQRSPGLCDIEGADVVRRLKERRGFGISGAFVVFHGVPLVHFTVKLRLYNDEDWDGWNAFKRVLEKLPEKRIGALDIWHPVLAEIGVVAALVESIGQPVQTADGEWTIAIKFCEQRAPQLTLARPEGSKATPVDPIDQEIDANTARIAALAAQ